VTEDAELIAGRYRLVAEVGSGGMGVVWRAKDEVLGRTVALKALTVRSAIGRSRDDETARRAMREARIAARLHHPNVIGVYDIVDHEGRPYLVMEFLASQSLSERLANSMTLHPQEVARIGAQVAAALTAAHKAGIVHRDVKPGNVLIAQGDATVKLTDFGISRAVGDTTVTASGVLLGTLSYIAPEVGQGQPADARSDVYSLGATLYAATEGKPPFGTDDNAIALLYRIVHEDIAPPRHAGPLAPILLWMLERDPALRPTMPQVQRALESIEGALDRSAADGSPGSPPEPSPPEPRGSVPAARTAVEPAVTIPSVPAPTPPPQAPPDLGPEPGADSDSDSGPESESAPSSEAAAQDAAGSGAQSAVQPQQPSVLSVLRRRRVAVGGLVAAVALAVGGLVLSQQPGKPPSNAGRGTPGSTPGSTHPVGRTSAASPPPTAPSVLTPSATTSQDLANQLTSTIVGYYQLMPGNVNRGWTWLTADYQQNHAGGRDGYTAFWARFQRVTVSAVTAKPPSTVVATIDYTDKNGGTVEERTSFSLVFVQGRWLIAGSTVLSSRAK
jgi:serine/threonine protein kinase